MWLVVGLGNPGAKYARNRHNIGFMVVDALARENGLPEWSDKHGGLVTSGLIGVPGSVAVRAQLLKPMEFMNLSGFAVMRAAQFHKVDVENILVVHDEIDLAAGIVRLKSAGGHGGHNGLRSITEQLGNKFQRLRMGVGRGDPSAAGARNDAAGWVLADFPKAHEDGVSKMISAGCEDIAAVLAHGILPAMNKHNARPSLFPSPPAVI
ncbi:MAG: aminoacyl-tRNA hydrolase [Deltaproteobacteria bacterium]|nr:aminoacyl-tRNA hydrolase [Deltaproteobacteria bacterium]